MAKIEKSAMHDFVDGTLVTEQHLDQNFELLRVALNDTVDDLNAHKTSGDHDDRYYRKSEVDEKLSLKADKTVTDALQQTKADKTYVDQQIAFIQSGQVADNAISTQKLQDSAVTTPKIANKAVTGDKVDDVTVYRAQTVDSKIAVAKADLQVQINQQTTQIADLQNQIIVTNDRIDNLQYNRDLDKARMDILTLTFEVTNLKNAAIAGMTGNIVTEDFQDVSDWTLISGLHDPSGRRIYLP